MVNVLHFCSVDDIKLVTNASNRFDDLFDRTRKSVTALFNQYTRRNLEYSDIVIEQHDSIATRLNQPFYVYLGKKRVVPGTLTATYLGQVVQPAVDHENGKLTFLGPSRYIPYGITVSYSGGFPPVMEADPADATKFIAQDYMDCPEELRLGAIKQSKWMLDGILNQGDGKKEQPQGRGMVPKQTTVQGLIPEVARMLDNYRKVFYRVV
jgi:hypothetical protein